MNELRECSFKFIGAGAGYVGFYYLLTEENKQHIHTHRHSTWKASYSKTMCSSFHKWRNEKERDKEIG